MKTRSFELLMRNQLQVRVQNAIKDISINNSIQICDKPSLKPITEDVIDHLSNLFRVARHELFAPLLITF